jgi:hypothetical protein
MSELVQRLLLEGPALSVRVLEDMYRADPFWAERFGARGRRHAEEDARYHVSYLVQALQAGDEKVLTEYARWLQVVLTSRGMCTRHLADNLERLARAIGEQGWPGGERAQAYLAAAVGALLYPAGAPRALQEGAGTVCDAALAALERLHPEWPAQERERCHDALRTHVSYLADALALESVTSYFAYVRWVDDARARQGVPCEQLDALLAALARAVHERVPEAGAAAGVLLAEVRAGLGQAEAPRGAS